MCILCTSLISSWFVSITSFVWNSRCGHRVSVEVPHWEQDTCFSGIALKREREMEFIWLTMYKLKTNTEYFIHVMYFTHTFGTVAASPVEVGWLKPQHHSFDLPVAVSDTKNIGIWSNRLYIFWIMNDIQAVYCLYLTRDIYRPGMCRIQLHIPGQHTIVPDYLIMLLWSHLKSAV